MRTFLSFLAFFCCGGGACCTSSPKVIIHTATGKQVSVANVVNHLAAWGVIPIDSSFSCFLFESRLK
jgi:hypothetical protein